MSVGKLVISDGAVRYILFQRTAYLALPKWSWYKRWQRFFSFPSYGQVVAFESWWRGARVKRLYEEDMWAEYESVRGFLPVAATAVLDIGCGIAGIDVFLSQHYNHEVDIFLLDKTHIEDEVYYFFKDRGAFYNSLSLAKKLLTDSGVPTQRVHLIDANEANTIDVADPVRFDVVLSLISWGFHYPVETYLEEVWQHLHDDGVLIIDIRLGTGGEDILAERFARIETVVERPGYKRIMARKQIGS